MIELRKVSKIYELGGEKIYALNQVNLQIADGDFVAIMGPSGSGKSTLANIVGGLDSPDSGEVYVNNRKISAMNDHDLSHYRNKTVGFIFQTFNLQPNLTALENVTIPLIFSKMKPAIRKRMALERLKQVGLADRANHRPSQLSGGQRQRVCIARALVNNPSLIIADEPTGSLDSGRGKEIIELLTNLNHSSQITLIVITHDSHVANAAQKIITLKDGRLS